MNELHRQNERKSRALRTARLFRAFAVSLSGDSLCKPCISAICNQCVGALLDFDIDKRHRKKKLEITKFVTNVLSKCAHGAI